MLTAYHPLTDGQIKVVNISLGNVLRALVKDQLKQWDNKLSHAEFTHNYFKNNIKKSLFEVVYGMNPINVVDLIPVPNVGQINV